MAGIADVLIEGVADAGGGSALRFAWDRGDNIGMVATGAFIIGGLVLPMFVRNQIVEVVSRGMFHSGAAIAGWLTTEKVMKMGSTAPALALGPGGARRALGRGNPAPSYNGARSPEVALTGTNPNTGEPIQFSGI